MTPSLVAGSSEITSPAVAESIRPALEWGIAFINDFRAAAPGLAGAARFFDLAGASLVLICLACCALWLAGARRGLALALAVIATDGVARVLAGAFRVPPPFVLAPGINLAGADGFSFPSARAAVSAVFFATLLLARRPRADARSSAPSRFALALAAPIPFGLAGVYLGAKYPTDALAGWALGALLFCIGHFAAMPLAEFLSRKLTGQASRARRNATLLAAAGFAFALNAIYRDGSMGGIAFGLCAGYAVLRERGERDTMPNASTQALVLLFALSVLALILVPLARALPGSEHAQYGLFRFARYALAGFWAGYAVPSIFSKLGSRNNGL